MSFEKGDIVRLKSGGPEMTILDSQLPKESNICTCGWFNRQGDYSFTFEVEGIPKQALKLVS